MSDDGKAAPGLELATVHDVLNDGLERCHNLVDQYRSQIVSALNPRDEEPPIFRWGGEAGPGEPVERR